MESITDPLRLLAQFSRAQPQMSPQHHSDLVVAVNSGSIDIIGGNVGNSVTRRPLALAADGTIVPITRGGETPFAIMECRIAELARTHPGRFVASLTQGRRRAFPFWSSHPQAARVRP